MQFYSGLGVLVAIVAIHTSASAQVMSSNQYQLLDYSVACGGGGVASVNQASFIAIEPAVSSEVNISANYRMSLGFLDANDPKPTDTPLIFDVSPSCGAQSGGTPVTIAGINFDKFGAGNTLNIQFGGRSAGSITVVSDTKAVCITPPGVSTGAVDIQLTTTFGSDITTNGFDYTNALAVYGVGTPGCTGTETVGTILCPKLNTPSFQLTCDNAPPNSVGLVIVTDVQDLAGTDAFDADILIHVGFTAVTEFFLLDIFSNDIGIGSAAAPIPNFPPIIGKSFYAQAIWYWNGACTLGQYDLSSSLGLKITVEAH